MRRCILLLFLATATSLIAQSPSVPEIPYRSVPGFLKLPPDLYLGEVAGVAVNSLGHVFVFSRVTEFSGLAKSGLSRGGERSCCRSSREWQTALRNRRCVD